MPSVKQKIVAGVGAALFLLLALCTALAFQTEKRLLPLVETARVTARRFDALYVYAGELVDIARAPEGPAPGTYARWYVEPERLFAFLPGEPVVLRFERGGETIDRAGVVASYARAGSVMEVLASPEERLPAEAPGPVTIVRDTLGPTRPTVVPREALIARGDQDFLIILVKATEGIFGPEYATEQAVVRVVETDARDVAVETLRQITNERVVLNPAQVYPNGTKVRIANE